MKEFCIKPTLMQMSSCKEFVSHFQPDPRDLILTNEYIFTPLFGSLSLPCCVIDQEKYGTGEPTDAMVEAILQDLPSDFHRVIAIGGGAGVLVVNHPGVRRAALLRPSSVLQAPWWRRLAASSRPRSGPVRAKGPSRARAPCA